MSELQSDAVAQGEQVDKAAYNSSADKASEGAIDSKKRPDEYVRSQSAEGTTHRVGETGSPNQTEAQLKDKWKPAGAKLPRGHKLIVVVKVARRIPLIGIPIIIGQLMFDDSYTVPDAVGDMVGAEEAQTPTTE